MKETKEACEEFMLLVFEHIVKATFEEYLFKVIEEIVQYEMVLIPLKSQLTIDDISKLLDRIHEKIKYVLFKEE